MGQDAYTNGSKQKAVDTIYKKKGVAFFLDGSEETFRNRLLISTIAAQGHSPRILVRKWTEASSGSVGKADEQNKFTLECKRGLGSVREYSKLLKKALTLIDLDFKKDKESGMLGTIYITQLVHLWFFLFFKRGDATINLQLITFFT